MKTILIPLVLPALCFLLAAPISRADETRDFKDTLTAFVWSWNNPGSAARGWGEGAEMRFLPDYTLVQKSTKGVAAVFDWRIVGPRTVVFGPKDGERRVVFDDSISSYQATETWNGNDAIQGARKEALGQAEPRNGEAASIRTVPGQPLAAEPGFFPLLDRDHQEGWKPCGGGGLRIDAEGVGTTLMPKRYFGVAWYSLRTFGDFVLRAEFSPVQAEYNSGIRLRFPAPGDDPFMVSQAGYEVSILHPGGDGGRADMKNGAIAKQQAPSKTARVRPPGEWNDIEVSVIGQRYSVTINGLLVTTFIGNKGLSGHIGIENHKAGAVRWRNIRIKDLGGASPAPAPEVTSTGIVPPAPMPATMQTDPNQPRIEVVKDQGPNAAEWALAPLDEAIPADIRQNLAFLREDLLDEGAKSAKASPEAYQLASDYCDKLLAALGQREIARVQAGYQSAQADANKAFSNQALDARRNHQMSWPQYAREESQRAALRESEANKADVKRQRLKVEWATRSEGMRSHLDQAYRQFRAAVRE